MKEPLRHRAPILLLVLLAVAGLVDSGFLAWDHQVFLLDPTGAEGICQAGGGCEIARFSVWSELPIGPRPGLPIALLGFAWYMGLLGLLLRRLAHPEDLRPLRLVIATSVLAVGYSAALAAISLGAQGGLCPYCAGLYVINALLLFVAWTVHRERPLDIARTLFPSAFSPPGLIFLTFFCVSLLVSYRIYSRPLNAVLDARRTKLEVTAAAIADAPVVPLALDGRPLLGPADAPITIVEVADLECPHCKTLYDTLHELRAEMPQRLRLGFLHHPLDAACNPLLARPFHQDACRLAVAAECAHRQGQFWAFVGYLFEKGAAATRADITAEAATLGLDPVAMERCLDDPATVAAIQADIAAGAEAGVRGTPNFYINGRHVVGARDADILRIMIDALDSQPTSGKD